MTTDLLYKLKHRNEYLAPAFFCFFFVYLQYIVQR